MATPADPAYREHLRALGDKFAASIPQRMQAIADALAAADDAPDPSRLEQVHHALHVVAGSAGSFGFAVLGDEARRLEQAVRALLANPASEPDWQTLIPQIKAYLAWAAKNPRDSEYSAHD